MNEIALPNQTQRINSQATVIEQTRAAAEVAAAVSVARDFPRSPESASVALRELCARLSVAQKAFYEVPNRGAGMSVHFARELARIWGNVDYGVRELRRDDGSGESEMQVWAWDIQQNVRSTRSFIQPHAKSLKGGGRKDLTDLNDIYLNNQNTGARAVRECIFTVIPGWLKDEAETLLRATLKHGDGKPLAQRIAEAVAAFGNIGVTQKQIETRIGRPVAKWESNHLAELFRVYSSIATDGIPAADFFPEQVVVVTPRATVQESSPMDRTPEEQAEDEAGQ